MESLIPVLFVLFVLLVIATLPGLGIWAAFAWFGREVTGSNANTRPPTILDTAPAGRPCQNCGYSLLVNMHFCGVCGAHRLTLDQEKLISELDITLGQLERLYKTAALEEVNFRVIKSKIEAEREQLLFPRGRPGAVKQPDLFAPQAHPRVTPPTPKSTPESVTAEAPFISPATPGGSGFEQTTPPAGAWAKDSDKTRPAAPVPKPPRKPFAEVLAAFMEQSNVRWGEIIGGLLIIGCSTALVISLWAQISRVPMMKFLIFTTVTAALFGMGFYTEHHWKLPTTSRGILTIATLLVPLNFLAIAAVSSGSQSGALVLGSELIAPAVFLCLVFLAGRVITPKWPHLLAAGALGSSVGQLLIRHFATPDISPVRLLALGSFPVLFYIGATGWSLKLALADDEIDEEEANALFVSLGALTFAAVLPFGLLLFKTGPAAMPMMYLAPLVTLGAAPMLGTGALLWQRVQRELAATRTAAGSIAILGMVMALAGMILAWPNPASIVPAALFNFAVFTAIAVFLNEPRAHIIAAGCLTFGYLIGFQVVAGHVPWQNLSVTALLEVTLSVSTAQALAIPFVLFVLVYEWLKRKRTTLEAFSYLVAACGAAVGSLLFAFIFGIGIKGDPHYVSAVIALYSAGAFWFAWREKRTAFSWAGATLLFLMLAQICHALLSVRFPWLASCLLFAAVCTVGALVARQMGTPEAQRTLVEPLRLSGAVGSFAAAAFLLALLNWQGLEPASLFATHTLFLAAVWMGLLVLSQSPPFFTAFQMALALGAVLVTNSYLQGFEWYADQPHAGLHPWALQIQGSVLGMFCFIWLALRIFARERVARDIEKEPSWIEKLLVDMPVAFDHLLAGALVIGFVVLTVSATGFGIRKELTSPERSPLAFDFGFPHELIFGVGSLILLIILLGVMFGNQRERGSYPFALGTLLMLWAVCPLLAGRFESQVATASAARWSVALFLIMISIAHAAGRKSMFAKSRRDFDTTRAVVLLLTLAPLIFLTLSPVIDGINYVPGRGPQSGIFRAMGVVALYGVPLVLAAAALGIHAARQHSAAYAFSAGLLVNLAVTTVLVVSVTAASGAMNRVVLVTALQLNAIAAACVALAWMALRTWRMKSNEAPAGGERVLLTSQKWMAVALLVLFIVPVGLHLIARPNRVGLGTFIAGSLNGWLALLLTVAVVVAFDKVFKKPISVVLFGASLIAAASLAAFGIAQFGVSRWAGLHVLLGSLVMIAWLLLFMKDLERWFRNQMEHELANSTGLTFASDWRWDSILFASTVGAIAVLVALRGPFSDPLGAWWAIGALLAMCALAAGLNWVTLNRVYLYAAGILVNLAASIWLIKYQSHQYTSLSAFIESNIVALSLTGVLWLCLELRARRARAPAKQSTAASFHNVAAILSLLAMASVITLRLQGDFAGLTQTFFPLLDSIALASLGVLMAACLWDRYAKYAVAGLYLIALLTAVSALHNLGLTPRRLAWGLMMAGAIHTLAASLIWRGREQILAWSARLKIPPRIDATANELVWLGFFNSLVIATVACLAFWIDLSFFPWSMRAAAALAVTAQVFTFGLMAEGQHRLKWLRAAVAIFLVGAVFFGWSCLTPGSSSTWLNRGVILMSMTFATVALFGIGMAKVFERQPDWSKAVRDSLPATTVAGVVSLGFVLGAEVYYQIEFGVVRVGFLALLAVAVTLVASVIACIFFALSPKHDPLSLSERTRGAYVYVAEVLLVLFFMHVRLTMPWLFRGFFQRYWPLVVLAIAYAGVAISEFLRRRQIRVLAVPIERTGAFLPLLPVLGFWIAQSQVEYSTLLFVVGGLYGLLSILRRSFLFGLAAALAGNGGLWYLLHETSEYHFFQHPQLWLIPAAISVLIAAHLNRKSFSEAQMTSIRYLCLATIYVSSTADIFINGVAQSPWLPLALAGLSVAGVFAGMIFRIRAFLFLGASFLLLAIATMINYASVNFGWTWLWYVAGIVTGALIITTFAIFEKKRADVLRVVDELRDWKT